jgi:hypothetical protein
MAQQLGPALEQRDDRLAWGLIDSGGPRFPGRLAVGAASGQVTDGSDGDDKGPDLEDEFH